MTRHLELLLDLKELPPARKLGLKEMLAAAEGSTLCPFCGDAERKKSEPVKGTSKRGQGRPTKHAPPGYYLTCGDEVCEAAYLMYWRRDQVARNHKRREDMSVAFATRLAS